MRAKQTCFRLLLGEISFLINYLNKFKPNYKFGLHINISWNYTKNYDIRSTISGYNECWLYFLILINLVQFPKIYYIRLHPKLSFLNCFKFNPDIIFSSLIILLCTIRKWKQQSYLHILEVLILPLKTNYKKLV